MGFSDHVAEQDFAICRRSVDFVAVSVLIGRHQCFSSWRTLYICIDKFENMDSKRASGRPRASQRVGVDMKYVGKLSKLQCSR